MIDQIDRQLINLLQKNARYSNAELAERVGLTTLKETWQVSPAEPVPVEEKENPVVL